MTARNRAKRKSDQNNGNEITAEQANEVIQKEKQERAERCKVKIQKALDEDRCQIRAYPFLNDGRILAGADIVAV